MRYPERRISELTGITDLKRLAMVEHYMREMYFYPWLLNSVSREEFDTGALVSVEELEKMNWDFV